MTTMDSFQIPDNYSDMSDTQYKKRKIECQPGEEPIAEFLVQESNSPNSTRNTYVYFGTQEDIASVYSSLALEDYWSMEKTGQLSPILEQSSSPDLIIPPLTPLNFQFSEGEQSLSPDLIMSSLYIQFSDDCLSPMPLQEQSDSVLEQPGSTEASTVSLSPSPVESLNDSGSEDGKPVEKKKKRSRKSNKKSSSRKRSSKKNEKKAGNKGQNRMKNLPGLIMQRVKTLVKRNSKFFIEVVFKKGLFLEEQEEFIAFIDRYNKDKKTWNSIDEFLKTNPRYARGYLELVYSFFTNEKEYKEYLKEGKMSLKNKELLWVEREKIMISFQENLGSKLETEEHICEE